MRPRLHIALTLVAVLAAALPAAAGAKPLLARSSACAGQEAVERSARKQERTMLCLINHARRAKGKPAVKMIGKLQRSSNRKDKDLLRCQQFSHTACGRDAFFWLSRSGFAKGCWGGGENLAWGSGKAGSPRSMMRAWLNSTPHRKVMLSRKFGRVGIAVRDGRFLGRSDAQTWVSHFGYRC